MERQRRIRKALETRARLLSGIRAFFRKAGFLEVETPVRIPAPAPEAHIDPEPSGSWFLQTSPELSMKRLLSAGYPRIFQICRCFRQRERGGRHLPEFTLLEWYAAEADYRDLMDFTEALIRGVAEAMEAGPLLSYQGNRIDLSGPWGRWSLRETFLRLGGVGLEAALREKRYEEVMGERIEPRLGSERPVFLLDYPAGHSPLARRKPEDPSLAERFELYIAGLELVNGCTELTDAAEQRRRLIEAREDRRRDGKTAAPLPEPFLRSLSRAPAAAGAALGIDRLAMLFSDAAAIDEVVAFTPEEL